MSARIAIVCAVAASVLGAVSGVADVARGDVLAGVSGLLVSACLVWLVVALMEAMQRAEHMRMEVQRVLAWIRWVIEHGGDGGNDAS